MDVLVVASFVVIRLRHYDESYFKVSDDMNDVYDEESEIHQIAYFYISYIALVCIGILVLRKIQKFYTTTPLVFILNLSVLILGMMLVISIQIIFLTAPNFLNLETT